MRNAPWSPLLMSRLMMVTIVAGFAAAGARAQEHDQAEGQSAVPEAAAQASRIFVASFGKDGNNGSRGAPKRNFQAAHDALAADGEIVVVDTANYGPLTITKGLNIIASPGVNGIVTAAGSSTGITINAAASDRVALRGLIIEGAGTNSSANGIKVNSLRALTVEDCTIHNLNNAVYFNPSGAADFAARRTTVRDVYAGFLCLNTVSGAVTTGTFSECAFDNIASTAVQSQNANSGGPCYVTVSHSVLSNSANAIYLRGNSNAQAVLDNSLLNRCTFCFYKYDPATVAYTRGNNTATYVANATNNGNSITDLPAF